MQTKKKYKTKYQQGLILTKTLKKTQKRIDTIKNLYGTGANADFIAKKLGFSRPTIIATLKRNNIPVRLNKYSGRTKNLITLSGIKVRSYPEKIIADMLFKKNIQFIYEQKILYNSTRFYPDFYIPKKDLYIEYAGLIGMKRYDLQLERKKLAMQELNKKYVIITEPEKILEVII